LINTNNWTNWFVQGYIFYRCQRFNTNQSKEQVRSQKKGARRNRRLPWSGTPDYPVRHRTVSGAPPDSVRCTRVLQLELFTFGFPRRSSAIIHRTVRCTSGATAICAQRLTLQSEQWNSDVRADGQRGTGLFGVAPDCPVPHEDKASNGRPAPSPNGKMTWRRTGHCPWRTGHCPVAHRTVRCALRQQTSSTASFWMVAINTTPTGHFKVWEPKQHPKSSS
jgi:hypothetical protein